MKYDKFGPRPVRILVLECHYWVDRACAQAAKTMGWEVAESPIKMIGSMPRDMVKELFKTILEHRPDFVLSVNLSGMDLDGLFAGLLDDLGVPHVTWFVDNPRAIMDENPSSATSSALAVTWDEGYVDYLRGCGFGDVMVLPLGLDETIFNHPPVDDMVYPPTFVGNSMICKAAEEWKCCDVYPGLKAAAFEALSSGRVTRQSFVHGIESILGPVVWDWEQKARYHAERIFFIDATRELRGSLVNALAPSGMVVRGDSTWEVITQQTGPSLSYVNELPQYYRACPINLNTTSVQMSKTVNQRVFDCPAAGGFLLTDAQEVIPNLFEVDREIVTYDSMDDAREKMNWFLAHPKARTEITTAARKRILGEHTYRHRLEAIVARLKTRFQG